MLPDYMIGKSGTLNYTFRVDLLDKDETFKRTLTSINNTGSYVEFNSLASIKRIAHINFVGEDILSGGLYPSETLYPNDLLFPKPDVLTEDIGDIDFLNDRIKIYQVFKGTSVIYPSETLYPSESLFPKSEDIEYPLGVFLLSSPNKTSDAGVTTYDITCYSKLTILSADKVAERTVITQGQTWTKAAIDIIKSAGITNINIPSSSKIIDRDIDFEIGTSKLSIANTLLDAINYTSLYTDGDGFIISEPYQAPDEKEIDLEYRDDEFSVIDNRGFSIAFDSFNTPNQWVGIASNPETEPLRSLYQNNNLTSSTSIQSRGRVIQADLIIFNDVSDQATLDAKVKRQANEDSSIYESISFNTAAIPLHGFLTKLLVDFEGESNKYIEKNWRINFTGTMKHTARRVVAV